MDCKAMNFVNFEIESKLPKIQKLLPSQEKYFITHGNFFFAEVYGELLGLPP